MCVCVVVPWRPGCPHREAAWAWVERRYRDRHPDWTVLPAPALPGPWCKAAAVMPAVEASGADIVVVADADVWTAGVELAVEAVSQGVTAWAIPHTPVHRLSQLATMAVLDGHDLATALEHDEPPYRGVPGGGIVVARREVIRAVPLDPRFVGWGQEDESWAIALECLTGPAWRGTAPLWHLWHPPQPRASRRRGNPDGWRLRRRYLTARHDRALMLDLVSEARDALSASQPAVHDRPPDRVR